MIPNSENKRVWFITGASKGLGYAFTCAALKAGDKVVAVARTIDNLTDRNCHFRIFADLRRNSAFTPNYNCFPSPNN